MHTGCYWELLQGCELAVYFQKTFISAFNFISVFNPIALCKQHSAVANVFCTRVGVDELTHLETLSAHMVHIPFRPSNASKGAFMLNF